MVRSGLPVVMGRVRTLPRRGGFRPRLSFEALKVGDITFCVMARSETNEFGRDIYRQSRVGSGG